MYYGGLGRTWLEWVAGESRDPATLPGRGDSTVTCWDADVNADVIAMCRRNDPACQGENMAALLELDYCDGYWSEMMYLSMTTGVIIGAVALVGGYLVGSAVASERRRAVA